MNTPPSNVAGDFRPRAALLRTAFVLIAALLARSAFAQAATPPSAAASANRKDGAADAVVELPEFAVSTAQDKGYLAGNSVSGTRINTPIKDLPFAVNA